MSAQLAGWAFASRAAALYAIDPLLTGVSLRAAPGPARDAWLALLREYLPADAPIKRAPLAIADDRLLGGLDLPATLRAGRPIAESGLLSQAHGGVLVLAMAERHSGATAARIAAALDNGEIDLVRDGLHKRHPACIGIVALDEGHDADERPPTALLDRLAFQLDLEGVGHRDIDDRVVSLAEMSAARARFPNIFAPPDAIGSLVVAAARLGIASLRAPLLALRVARASAALRGAETVADEDLETAARFVLAPRATCAPAAEDEMDACPEPEQSSQERNESQPGDPQNDNAQQRDSRALDDVVLAAARAAIPSDLLARLGSGALAKAPTPRGGKSGAATVSARRGRPMGARRGALREGRLSLIETLRAAAPWQTLRQCEATGATSLAVRVRSDDFRIKRYRESRETTAIFVVDASGSAAMARLAEVKGAIELLLADCYVRRDHVALIAFRGKAAEIVLPPTRSLARAKRLLAALPGGGGTPLALGLDAASALADSVRRKGQTPLLVLLTDGRANIDRAGAPGRAKALEDALAAGRRLRGAGVSALAIDSSPGAMRGDAPTRKIAEAMNGRYVKMPVADATRLSQAVRAAAPAS